MESRGSPVSVRHKGTYEYAAAAPPTGREIIIRRAAVLMLRDGEDAAQGWEGEYKSAFDRKKCVTVSVAQWNSALDF